MPEDNTATTPSIPPVDPTVAGVDSAAMPDNDVASETNTTSATNDVPVANDVSNSSSVVDPMNKPEEPSGVVGNDSIYSEVAGKIRDSKNVLIALSSDPSVDEMAAAIGLSLYLDKLGKRATAIYSGSTPNALEFLKPEDTFESSADTLQDFVIALSKEKADHLRYKLDGDYVKIYITPYKARISEEDLDFSYGDFNVDLVLALDVANGIDLDSALREHGRIMHDAVIINITTGNPGKFGEIEWSDKHASSVSEMIAKLLFNVSGAEVNKEEATAFLTGIVAATNRFSNAGTTPETMQIASKLMKSGANQQLVSKNITPDLENEMMSLTDNDSEISKVDDSKDNGIIEIEKAENEENTSSKDDPTSFDVRGKDDVGDKKKDDKASSEVAEVGDTNGDKEEEKPEDDKKDESEKVENHEEDNSLLDDLKAAEESLSHAGAEAVPETKEEKVTIDSEKGTSNMDEVKPEAPSDPKERTVEAPAQEKVLQPSGDLGAKPMTMEEEEKYGKMLENALESVSGEGASATSTTPVAPVENPAAMNAPTVPENPEINGVPEMNYMPMPDEQILPPPPTPPIDMSGAMPVSEPVAPTMPNPTATPVEPTISVMPTGPIEPAAPVAEPEPTSLGEQPAMQDQVYNPQGSDPGAFKIPGM